MCYHSPGILKYYLFLDNIIISPACAAAAAAFSAMSQPCSHSEAAWARSCYSPEKADGKDIRGGDCKERMWVCFLWSKSVLKLWLTLDFKP